MANRYMVETDEETFCVVGGVSDLEAAAVVEEDTEPTSVSCG